MKTPKFYTLEATFAYVAYESDSYTMDATLDQIVDHLLDLDARDVSLVADLGDDQSDGQFALSLIVPSHPGESIETVLGRGMGTVRAAFHACEAATPGWPSLSEMLTYVSVQPSREQVEIEDKHAGDLVDA
ncbi:hypothetical protein [Aeromicrobium fastidiosum]|uniref:Uncharacterized protein n=1 Tax=Aeromicrobium fastidiosum TaxID=52699 RepID=A0A641AM13_9ACTN|nr:hypothetical protein [Aeromicrobium fastidiosum]KAA1378314.1 hypothetical protein ESP62_008040 [Aeromicrobium fastidiosum]MBP2392743.1 hypothetical protein [Aeromicrobium fastidiosum]